MATTDEEEEEMTEDQKATKAILAARRGIDPHAFIGGMFFTIKKLLLASTTVLHLLDKCLFVAHVSIRLCLIFYLFLI